MNNFFKRLITAIFFTGTLLGSILWNQYSFFILFIIICLLTLHEFYKIIRVENIKPQLIIGYLSALSVLFTTALVVTGMVQMKWLSISLPVLFCSFIYELYTKSERPFTNIAYTIFGIVYIVFPFALLLVLPFLLSGFTVYQPNLIFGYFLILWASDTGAYLAGMAFGKRKLFERISPKKSWEGSIGGVLSVFLVAWCCSIWFPLLSFVNWSVSGVIIVITGTFGDLAESLLKRSLNIKDSGNILPGHGGLLDRFDALLVSVPFVATYLILIQ